jgi:AcrR family transcriptional regulator
MTAVIRNNRAVARSVLRASIETSAIRLFRERGYAMTPVDAIVADAGVAKGTFFNFFPAKLDVLKAYYRAIDLEIARIRRRLDPAAPRQSLRQYATDVEQILRREGALMLEMLALTQEDESFRSMDEDSGSLDTDEFAEFLKEAQRGGSLSSSFDAAVAAATLVDLWSGAMRTWRAAPSRVSLAAIFDLRVSVLIRGLAR